MLPFRIHTHEIHTRNTFSLFFSLATQTTVTCLNYLAGRKCRLSTGVTVGKVTFTASACIFLRLLVFFTRFLAFNNNIEMASFTVKLITNACMKVSSVQH